MKTTDKRITLSLLWVFLTVNYIFCDVFSLMYSGDLQQIITGKIGDIKLTQEFLLTFAIVMEIPMLMILFSRFMKHRTNGYINMIIAFLLIIVQVGSLVVDTTTLHYCFFSIIEIITCLIIIKTACGLTNTNQIKTITNENN